MQIYNFFELNYFNLNENDFDNVFYNEKIILTNLFRILQ